LTEVECQVVGWVGGDFVSCDEYPFAATTDGGKYAIIRGVPVAENLSQGQQFSAFLTTKENANELEQLKGKFYVCVHWTNGQEFGECS
jgi:hypothetical protein